MTAVWVLAVWVLALRILAPAHPEDERWATRIDLPLALACGAGFAFLTAWWFPAYFLVGWNLTSSDFAQYCESVDAVRDGAFGGVNPQRSMYAALLPGALAARWGVVGGLALSALAAQFVSGMALYVWGRTVAGRLAGLSTAVLASCLGPMVVLARTVTFYPQMVAAMLVCATGGALAARHRTAPSLAAAGAGAGIALLWDVRGLYWALPILALGLVAAIDAPGGARSWRARMRMAPGRIAVLLFPVFVSWWVGFFATPPNATGLTTQTLHFLEDALRTARSDAAVERVGADFVWGRTSPVEVPRALLRVAELSSAVPPGLANAPEVQHARETWLAPWALPAGSAGLVAVFALARRPWNLAALVVPAFPYAMALWSAAYVQGHPRYLAAGVPAIGVVLGVGLVLALRGPAGIVPRPYRTPLVVALLVLLVLGVVPSWLSPVAPWRRTFNAEQYPRVLQTVATKNEQDAPCMALLAADAEAGRSWSGYPPTVR